jgi:hypothetical protein
MPEAYLHYDASVPVSFIDSVTNRKRGSIRRASGDVGNTVVAETWRGPSTHARTAHLFGSVDAFPD